MTTTPGTQGAETTLAQMPSLGRLYSRALGRSATLVLARRDVGEDVPDVTYRVDGVRADADRLAAYQHLLGEPGTDVLPAGFVHVLAFPLAMALMVRADFPLPVLGLVHVGNRVVQHRPVHLEESLTVWAHAGGLRPHRRGRQVDLVVTVDSGGERVWEGTSTYLAKGAGPATASADSSSRDRAEVRASSCTITDAGAGAQAGPGPTAVWRLGADVGRRYAEVSGDRNPIHVSRVGARLFGFPRPIAHGMYTAARALAAVGPVRGEAFLWEVAFAKPVLLPGSVALAVVEDGGTYRYTGTHARRGTVHFSGSVERR